MHTSWIERSETAPDYADFISNNVWLHSRLVLAVITDRDGNHVQTQLALVAEESDPRPALRELASCFVESIGADEAVVASCAIDMREQFADAFLSLMKSLKEEASVEGAELMLDGVATAGWVAQ